MAKCIFEFKLRTQMCARTHSVCNSDGAVATSKNNITATKYRRRRIENSWILFSMQFRWEMSWQKPSKWFWMIPYVLFMPLKCTPQIFCGMSIFLLYFFPTFRDFSMTFELLFYTLIRLFGFVNMCMVSHAFVWGAIVNALLLISYIFYSR